MRPLTFTAVILLLALSPNLSTAAPMAASTTNVLLARDRTEPVVAVDPRFPSIIVAGSNTDYGAPVGDLLPTAYFASANGGRTFTQGEVPMQRPYTTGADPSVAIAADGTVFFSYLGETPSYCSGGRSAIVLTHSIDHGRNFRAPVLVDVNPADDKPLMTVESVVRHPSHLFLTWTRWHNRSSDIWFARSGDGGAHFGRPRMLHTSLLDNFAPTPIVGPHGHVYVFWASFPEAALRSVAPATIFMRASADDGAHFGPLRRVRGPFSSIPRMTQPESLRNLTAPAVAVDGRGHVYLSWAQVSARHADGSVDADIELMRSANAGRTWSRAVRVNDVRRGDRFMPAITTWRNGSVGIAFYDRRNGPDELDVYATRVTFSHQVGVVANRRINQRPSPASDVPYIAPGSTCFSPGRFFGDYIGVGAAPHKTLCVVWADTQLHVPSETDIWFSKTSF